MRRIAPCRPGHDREIPVHLGLDRKSRRASSTRSACCVPTRRCSRSAFAFVGDEPPVIVDWLPWSHTFGSNHNFNLVLDNGGSLYIDDGKPLPGAIAATARNLSEIAPTIYFNVPKGFEALLPHLRADEAAAPRTSSAG